MSPRTTLLSDATDIGPVDPSNADPGAPGDPPFAPSPAGGPVPVSGNSPLASNEPPGVATPLPCLFAGSAAGGNATPQPVSNGSDPLAAFLDGLQQLSSDGGGASIGAAASPAAAAASPPVTMLSNGLNADAGVAQLVSALASVHDGNAAFNPTPFAASSDPGLDAVIAPALR